MLQGIAAGITWAASMAWLSANTPRDRLPRESGIVMGLFSTGAVIGPGVGSFAHATSPGLAFTCLAGAAALTIPLALRAPVGVTVPRERSYVRSIGSVLSNRLVQAAILLSVIDPISLGAIDLLVPRHLHSHGVPTWHIGAALMVGAALGAIAGPLAGTPRRADRPAARRHGRSGGTRGAADDPRHRPLRPGAAARAGRDRARDSRSSPRPCTRSRRAAPTSAASRTASSTACSR